MMRSVKKRFLKSLGVHIDEKLNFNRHILELCAKLSKFCGLFYKLRSILTTAQLLVIYKVYVQQILNYGVLVYGTSSKTTVQPLEAKKNKLPESCLKREKRNHHCKIEKSLQCIRSKFCRFLNCL